MNIAEVAAQINQRAAAHAIGELQQIRVRLKSLSRSSSRTIFSSSTTFEDWAFHHGGRTELQFNIGMEVRDDGIFIRHGVAFSLETSRSLPSIDVLVPKIRLFNEFVRKNGVATSGFEMWHFQDGQRSGNRAPTSITADLVEPGVFVFLGALQPIDQVDYGRMLSDFDALLPLYKFVESDGAISSYQDSPETFAFRAGHNAKKHLTTATWRQRELSVSLRHNVLQAALHAELCAEYGAENVGTERASGSGGRIDAVVSSAGGYTFYEIKVGQSLQACIREAVGQLLEYSYWPGSQHAAALVIVGEPSLDDACRAYLERLQRDLSIPVSYRQIVCMSQTG